MAAKSPDATSHPTRRSVLFGIGAAAGTLAAFGAEPQRAKQNSEPTPVPVMSFIDILRQPDSIRIFMEGSEPVSLTNKGKEWTGKGVLIDFAPDEAASPLTLHAPNIPLLRIHLRWRAAVKPDLLILSDAWERSYGDLGWQQIVAERPLPWYFCTFDGKALHGYGVATGASALAFWQCDGDGVSLWLDVRNGGKGVLLGERKVSLATIIVHQGWEEEAPFQGLQAFCKSMCSKPRLPVEAIYGSNDWYYAYGENSADGILRDATLMGELAKGLGPRPFTVIDDGWQNPKKFPDMAALALRIRDHGVRPGIWVRPLQANAETNTALLLPPERFPNAPVQEGAPAYDPTIPEALDHALAKIRQAVDWKYDLVKHDFSTYELLGQWGKDMLASPALPGWSFHDRSKTTAEVMRDLYIAIRKAAGDQTILIGCNVMGHLSAGIFEGQRIGDDVSGKDWERTRRMGVNALTYRLPQHKTFFAADADCVPVTRAVPWNLTKEWLKLVANSGTALLVSPDPQAIGPEQKQALKEAFAVASTGGSKSVPADWLETRTPAVWHASLPGKATLRTRYRWLASEGASPFQV